MDSTHLRHKIERLKGKRETLLHLLQKNEEALVKIKDEEIASEQALEFLQKVAIETQSSLKYNIETPVTSALAAVLEEPYEFKIDFDIKRGRTDCKLLFSRDGNTVTPKDSSGGTALDVAAFALRIALWSIAVDKTRPVMILDECFKHVSEDLRAKTGAFVKKLSEAMGIQFILVSHDQKNLVSNADKVFHVKLKNRISTVTEV